MWGVHCCNEMAEETGGTSPVVFPVLLEEGGVSALVLYSPTQFPLPLLDQITATTLISLVYVEVSCEVERSSHKRRSFYIEVRNEGSRCHKKQR